MFNAQKFRKYVKDILFPPFSERELITLAYLIVSWFIAAVISDPSALWDFITAGLGLTELVFYGLGALVTIGILYDIAMQQRKESFETKKFAAYIFYAALSLMSLMVLLHSSEYSLVKLFFPLPTGRLNISALFNSIIMGFLLLRSALTALVTYAYAELDQEHLLAARMTDEQMNRTELVMLIVAATTIFLLLLQGQDRLVAVLLSYFYVTLLFDIYRKIFPQQDPAFIKSIKRVKLK